MKIMKYVLTACMVGIATGGCDRCTRPDPETTDFRLFLCMEGQPRSVLIVNPITLAVEDTLHLPGTPHDIEFSEDYKKWYVMLSWTLLEVDARTMEITRQVRAQSSRAAMTSNDLLITYRRNVMEFWALDVLKVVHSDSLYVLQIVQDPIDAGTIYGTFRVTDPPPSRFGGIFEYDTESFSIRRTIEVDRIGPHDLEISNDGKYLFLTGSGGGIDAHFFYVIDVELGDVVAKHQISGHAQMGLSPDGRYVYLSDPGEGFLTTGMLVPQGMVRRYDIDGGSMEQFIDLSLHIDSHSQWPPTSDRILMMPDNRTAYLTSWEAGHHVMKWDFERKVLLDATDFDVTQGQVVREMELGKRY